MITKKEKILSIITDQKEYTFQNNTICFLPGDRSPIKSAGEGLLAKTQDMIKRRGRLYYLFLNIFSPVLASKEYRSKMKSLLNRYGENEVIINLGSGPQRIYNRPDVINIDISAFDEVDIAADASDLPIKDNSVDLIINIAMLEHILHPQKVVIEMKRILRHGGEMICYLPFMMPFHGAPCDYYRWTVSGTKQLFEQFKDIEIGVGSGPTSGMLWVLQEWLATLFSFENKTLHDVLLLALMSLTFPVKLLDLILTKFPSAEKIAGAFYVVIKK